MTGPAAEGPGLIWCPFPHEEEARAVASTLLDEGLVACANIVPGMVSLFAWEGERGEQREAGALFKTDAALLDSAIARIDALHSYAAPAIVGWRGCAANQATRAWLGGLVAGSTAG